MTQLTNVIIQALESIKANDIQILDVRKLTSITDYMIIASGTSTRHVQGIAQEVIYEAKQAHFQAIGLEGMNEGEWVLIDLNDVVVHVMLPKIRDFYQLDKLWTRHNDNWPACA